MKRARKILAFLLVTVLLFLFASCGESVRNSLRDAELSDTQKTNERVVERTSGEAAQGNGSAQTTDAGERTPEEGETGEKTADPTGSDPQSDRGEEPSKTDEIATGNEEPPRSNETEKPASEGNEQNVDTSGNAGQNQNPDETRNAGNGEGDSDPESGNGETTEPEEKADVYCAECGALMKSGGNHFKSCSHYAESEEDAFIARIVGAFGGVPQDKGLTDCGNTKIYDYKIRYMEELDMTFALYELSLHEVVHCAERADGSVWEMIVREKTGGKAYEIEAKFSVGPYYDAILRITVSSLQA